MLSASLATLGLLIALALGACDEPSDGQMSPPQEPVPGTAPPTQ
jgi:hypothetical protein